MRSATIYINKKYKEVIISTHALHAECDSDLARLVRGILKFQPTHSMRSATLELMLTSMILILFQSTHSMRSATADTVTIGGFVWISIHALHAECDLFDSTENVGYVTISIHALHAECD